MREEQKNNENNKFSINFVDENEIINKIKEKTNLDKDKIKRAIKFKYKEPEYNDKEYESGGAKEEQSQPTAQQTQSVDLGYMTKVNGSVIIRLG